MRLFIDSLGCVDSGEAVTFESIIPDPRSALRSDRELIRPLARAADSLCLSEYRTQLHTVAPVPLRFSKAYRVDRRFSEADDCLVGSPSRTRCRCRHPTRPPCLTVSNVEHSADATRFLLRLQ